MVEASLPISLSMIPSNLIQQVDVPTVSSATSGYDYTALPAGAAGALRQTVIAIHAIQRGAIADVGQHLIAAKSLLPHGAFRGWAQAELGMTVRSAERYMRAAEFLNGKPDIVSYLPSTILFALSAPTAPTGVVKDVIAAAETGILAIVKNIKAALTCAIKEERATRMQSIKIPGEITEEDEQHQLDKQREGHRLADEQARKEHEPSAEREREARLYPLAQKIAEAIGPDDRAALVAVLRGNPLDRLTFGRLMSMVQLSGGDDSNDGFVADSVDMASVEATPGFDHEERYGGQSLPLWEANDDFQQHHMSAPIGTLPDDEVPQAISAMSDQPPNKWRVWFEHHQAKLTNNKPTLQEFVDFLTEEEATNFKFSLRARFPYCVACMEPSDTTSVSLTKYRNGWQRKSTETKLPPPGP